MHWFVHGSVGVLAANAWPDHPLLALGVSLGSHYLLDVLPHKDPGIAAATAKWRSPEVREFLTVMLPDFAFTGALGVVLPAVVPLMPFWLTAGCVMAAVLPDLIDGIAKLTGGPLLQLHRTFHDWIHYDHYRRPVHWGFNVFIHAALFAAAAVATWFLTYSNGVLAVR